ncbi:hypothetical protein [Dyella acidisoli]|uniref:Uncharacterized protein n=1 Tax=Dyella acidisoli TaxID=1867834 RepID=A0ABQ5XW73_9GAMM|nr:hypothetical protein [Dyella acidisoli]GLQ95577.1 hypothetical protein GCM10007901_45330 [Dyella acidisoli]
MSTHRLRNVSFWAATAFLMLQPLHAQGGGLSAGDVDGVCLVKGFRTGVGGMRLPVWRPYLLLKDGTAYKSPKLAPDSLDVAQSRQSEASSWGTWTGTGNDRTISMPGQTSMTSAQCMQPADAGKSIQGNYKHVGGGGNTVSGGHASFMRSDNYRFYSDGRFISRSSSGLIAGSAAVASSDGTRTGHYRIHDYSIDLRYDDGSEAHLFFYADGDQLLHIGDADYVPSN